MKTIIAVLFLGAFFGLSAVLGGNSWYLIGLSYALFWPAIFAFVILPGVLIGSRMQTWQSSVILSEVITVVVTIFIVYPNLEQVLQPLFGKLLSMTHLALFPPLLLSVLIGHFGRSSKDIPDLGSPLP